MKFGGLLNIKITNMKSNLTSIGTVENCNAKINELFIRWEEQLNKDGFFGFCRDGLMFRGENWKEQGDDGKLYDGKYSGNEETMWANVPKRILFLLKDSNKNPGYDNREFYPGVKGSLNTHYRNLAYWLFGLLAFDETKDAPAFESLNLWDEVYSVFDTKPFAIVNCKKESGGSYVSNENLQEHINRYADFIKEEIAILNPDIIVCGGGSSLIKKFVADNVYRNLEKINNWIYFDKFNNKVVIDSYHPSYWQISGGSKTIYTKMMNAYKEFLEKHPDFRHNCRM